jgi:hypothetical protein
MFPAAIRTKQAMVKRQEFLELKQQMLTGEQWSASAPVTQGESVGWEIERTSEAIV